jgi:pyruvate,water dikinase
MGLQNVKLMRIPFVELSKKEKVIAEMEKWGNNTRRNELEIYVMIEIPSNVILADEFAQLFLTDFQLARMI